MGAPSQKDSSPQSIPGDLVMMACDVVGQIVTCITSNRVLVSTMNPTCLATRWKRHDAYQKAFDRLLHGLKAEF